MRDWRRLLGVFIGVCIAAAVTALTAQHRPAEPAAGPILSDCDGALQELVIHYVPEAGSVVERTLRRFLGSLPRDVQIHVVCPDRAAFDDLLARLGEVPAELRPVFTEHEMTFWSRDRWLALAPAAAGRPLTLLLPRTEDGEKLWPQRAGDARVGYHLSRALGERVRVERSRLHFDGGDFAADADTVFVAPAVLRRNLQRTVRNAAELVERLSKRLRKRVVLLEEAPEHHVGMYLMPVGGRTVLVGDPRAAAERLGADGKALFSACGGADFSRETQSRFDAVAAQCVEAGYRVVRMPIVPGCDGRTYLTYLNVILDQRDGRRVVYMPVYEDVPALNTAAEGVWRGLGYEVRPVDCSDVYIHFGSLRCLVNVLRRG